MLYFFSRQLKKIAQLSMNVILLNVSYCQEQTFEKNYQRAAVGTKRTSERSEKTTARYTKLSFERFSFSVRSPTLSQLCDDKDVSLW
jgi:hypothetical protein